MYDWKCNVCGTTVPVKAGDEAVTMIVLEDDDTPLPVKREPCTKCKGGRLVLHEVNS